MCSAAIDPRPSVKGTLQRAPEGRLEPFRQPLLDKWQLTVSVDVSFDAPGSAAPGPPNKQRVPFLRQVRANLPRSREFLQRIVACRATMAALGSQGRSSTPTGKGNGHGKRPDS